VSFEAICHDLDGKPKIEITF